MYVVKFETRYKRDGSPVDWIEYAQSQVAAQMVSVVSPVSHVMPKLDELGEPSDQNDRETVERWQEHFGPAYEAWKKGIEVPETGVPIGSWPALTEGQIRALRIAGVSTVDELATMGDETSRAIRLPNKSDLKRQAQQFLEGLQVSKDVDAMAKKDEQINALMAQVQELLEANKAASAAAPQKRRGRPPKAQTAAAEPEAEGSEDRAA